ncbi:MAG: hypothetical protein AB7H80_06560 [Candidatus Kapaibacterium sp.]
MNRNFGSSTETLFIEKWGGLAGIIRISPISGGYSSDVQSSIN